MMALFSPQGFHTDDSATNCVLMICNDGTPLYPGCHTDWGDWYERSCGSGQKICGIRTRVEAAGESDYTGLNNIDLYCCSGYPDE